MYPRGNAILVKLFFLLPTQPLDIMKVSLRVFDVMLITAIEENIPCLIANLSLTPERYIRHISRWSGVDGSDLRIRHFSRCHARLGNTGNQLHTLQSYSSTPTLFNRQAWRFGSRLWFAFVTSVCRLDHPPSLHAIDICNGIAHLRWIS
jgi:hypothetical protein